jgi:hypothetical protein
VFFSDGSSKTLQKTFHKKFVSKSFYKKSTKNPKPTFSRKFFNHVFGRFSMRGVQKHDKTISEKKSDPSPFSYSDPPTHHGGHRFVFCRPLEKAHATATASLTSSPATVGVGADRDSLSALGLDWFALGQGTSYIQLCNDTTPQLRKAKEEVKAEVTHGDGEGLLHTEGLFKDGAGAASDSLGSDLLGWLVRPGRPRVADPLPPGSRGSPLYREEGRGKGTRGDPDHTKRTQCGAKSRFGLF